MHGEDAPFKKALNNTFIYSYTDWYISHLCKMVSNIEKSDVRSIWLALKFYTFSHFPIQNP